MNSGKAAYVERNYEMIDNSHYCIVYYDEPNVSYTRKSGTKIALDYAIKKHKTHSKTSIETFFRSKFLFFGFE